MSTDVDESEVKNHYKAVPKKFKEEDRHYANEAKVKIKLPFRMCITGTSGSGKTNCLVEIIEQINAFDKIMIWAKDTEEPLYATMIDSVREAEKKTGASILTVSNDINDLPELKTISKENNTLLIIDDMINEKDKMLKRVAEYYTMGRKKYVSPIFLSQSYFKIPKIIRENSNYFIFTKISGDRDLLMILKDFNLGVTEDQLIKLFRSASTGFPNFFLIDRQTNEKDLVFRKNFKGIKAPEETATKASSNIVARMPGGPSSSVSRTRPGRDESGVPYTKYSQEPEPYHPNIIPLNGAQEHYEGKLKKQAKEAKKAEEYEKEFERNRMDIVDPDEDIHGMYDEEGEGIKIKKKRKRKGGAVTDLELNRMLRMYGYKI